MGGPGADRAGASLPDDVPGRVRPESVRPEVLRQLLAPPPPAGAGPPWALLALGAAGLVLRLDALGLPLLQSGAEVAVGARAGGAGAFHAPLHGGLPTSVLATPLVALGVPATYAVRTLEVLAGAAIAPLAARLAGRWGAAPAAALLVGLLALLHPSVAIAVGGAAAHGHGVAPVALMLGVLALGAQGTAAARRAGGLGVLVAAGAPFGFLLALPLIARHVRREPDPRLRVVGPLAVAALVVLVPGSLGGPPGGTPAGVTVLAGLGLAVGGPLLLGWPWALRGLGRGGALGEVGRVGLVAGGLAYLLASLLRPLPGAVGPLLTAPLLVPLAIVAGARGLGAVRPRLASGTRLTTLALSSVLTLALAIPALGRLLPAGAESAAATARWLQRATALAEEAAGPDGLVGFAAPRDPAEAASAADLVGRRDVVRILARSLAGAEPTGAGWLPVLATGEVDPQRTLGIVAERGVFARVQALGDGQALFRFTPVKELGPFAVLRARRD
jgi:hypothetical protein